MKWYDYIVAVWFAFTIWLNLMTLNFLGLMLQLLFYAIYEYFRKVENDNKL